MQPGDVIAGQFRLEQLAASGGMGAVYRATDLRSNDVVAVKVLRDPERGDSERFLAEARLLETLRHPGIVRHVAHGEHQSGSWFLAMEWLDGHDLSKRLRAPGVTPAETVRVASHVAEALAFAHARGIVHRDIKPSNVFLVDGSVENVRILDFGIARAVSHVESHTLTGAVMGTPGYMAPEQARGDRDIDARADLYSLGCVLYHALAGQPPFSAAHAMAVLAKILLEEPAPIATLRADLPESLDDLVGRLLSKDRNDRPESAARVLEALSQIDAKALSHRRAISTRPPALTASEQRWWSVVFVGPGGPRTHGSLDAPTVVVSQVHDPLAEVRAVAERFGGAAEALLDGSIVVSVRAAGAPIAQAVSAAHCAANLRTLLPERAIALATGQIVSGAHQPLGQVIDLAARLLHGEPASERTATGVRTKPDMASLGSATEAVRIDDATASLVAGEFEVGRHDAGWWLGTRRGIDAVARVLLGRPTPFVGREREVAIVEGVLEQSLGERVAAVALITGAAGMGKSRLRAEVLSRLNVRRPDVRAWIARGDAMRAGSPFTLMGQLVQRSLGIGDSDPLDVRRERLIERIARLVDADATARVAEFLGELIGTSSTDDPSVQLRAARQDPALMGDQTRRALDEWLAGECRAGPLAVILEDLHWGDAPSVQLLDAALERLREFPLVLLAFARPDVHERFPNLWSQRDVLQLPLRELSRRACEQLARQFVPERSDPALVEAIVARSAGNAFFLEELIRAQIEGREGDLPDSVLAIVQARLERLEPEARRALRAASVFGEVFWRGGVLELLGGERVRTSLGAWLDLLVEREVITPARASERLAGEVEFGFRHALIREAAYAMLTAGDRVLGHRLAGEWLQRAGERDALALAEHFERGDETARAGQAYADAALQAMEGNDFASTVARAERAIGLGADRQLTGRMRALQAEAGRWLCTYAEGETHARDAVACLDAYSSGWWLALGELVTLCGKQAKTSDVVELAQRFVGSRGLGDVRDAWIVASTRAALQCFTVGRRELAVQILEQVDQPVSEMDPRVPGRLFQARITRAAHEHDDVGYLRAVEGAIEAFEAAGDMRNVIVQRVNAGFASSRLGRYAEGARLLAVALTEARRMNLESVANVALHNLGLALANLGRFDEALAAEREAIERLNHAGDLRIVDFARVYLGRILLARGEPASAFAAVESVALGESSLPASRAYALAVAADARLATGRTSDALDLAGRAMTILDELGAIEEGATYVRTVLGESLSACGQHGPAVECMRAALLELRAAADRIDDAGMRATFLDRVPEHARALAFAARLGLSVA